MRKLDSVTIVGGGTAGFVSALILKTRFPYLKVEVIRSTKIGIIGVGEGSTEHWSEFMTYIGVNFKEVIAKCDATFKGGIMFSGWGPEDFLHSTSHDFDKLNGQSHFVYSHLISNQRPKREMNPQRTWREHIPARFAQIENNSAPYNQFHFNTHKLNEFLTNKSIDKGIIVTDDEILDVLLNEQGEVSSLQGNNGQYTADFFIDCTGFKRLLIGKLGAKWESHSKYLKMKSAIVFPTEETNNYPLWTLAKTMDYGWRFRIPTQGRYGNGYIFDSDYINADQAKEEIDKEFGYDVEIGKQINFDPGALDLAWIKNCVAVGLSGNFIEPLEATSIGTSIQQMFLLMHRLPNYTEKTIEKYNADLKGIMNNIRDFIVLHYITKKDNSQFWIDLQSQKIPDSLAEKLERFKHNLPIEEDFRDTSKYSLFGANHYIHILYGLDLFNINSIKNEYNMFHPYIKELAVEILESSRTYDEETAMMTHKRILQVIRSHL
jgi:tryptophan halogenase